MPNCFSLRRKGNPEAGPVVLTTVDEEICRALDEEVDEKLWCRNWYNIVGLLLACGKSFDDIREICSDTPAIVEVVNFLADNFVSDAWYSRR